MHAVCILDAPKIHIEPQFLDQVVKVDQSIKFSATVTGIPKPSLAWYKNGVEIEFTEHVVLTEKDVKRGTIVNLVVRECRPLDAGNYQLVASNVLGTDNVIAHIVIKGECKVVKANYMRR